MFTRDPGAPFGTPNVVIGRQGHNELTLSFRPLPYLSTLLNKQMEERTFHFFDHSSHDPLANHQSPCRHTPMASLVSNGRPHTRSRRAELPTSHCAPEHASDPNCEGKLAQPWEER